MKSEEKLARIKNSIVEGDSQKTIDYVNEALNLGLDYKEILNEAIIKGSIEVGELYEQEKYFLPDMLMTGDAINTAMDLLKNSFIEVSEITSKGDILIGTVEGDVHDIGLKLVGMMLEGAGLDVVVLGADTSKEEFLEAIKEHNANILGMSALLTTTMPEMKEVIDFLKENGLREKVKVMVGGATLNQRFADEYGADGFAPDAAQASVLAKRLLAEQSK